VEIAVATNTAPAQWRGEDDWTLATVVDVLTEQSKAIRGAKQ
jgi:hypothetical protein